MKEQEGTLQTDTLNAAVVNNALVSFVGGMSSLGREYTRESYLLASSYVTDVLKAPRGSESWFDEFIKVMTGLGWLTLRSSFERESSTRTGLTLELLALKALAGVIASVSLPGAWGASLPQVALAALEGLKENKSAFDLFKKNTGTKQGGDFGLVSCVETRGEVMMAVVNISAASRYKVLGIPFLEWESSSAEVFSGRACLALDMLSINEAAISLLRGSVGDKVLTAIAQYKI